MDTKTIDATSFQEMLALFPIIPRVINVGGYGREVQPFYFRHSADDQVPYNQRDVTKHPGYHVEASYSAEQMPYVQRAMMLLTKLVEGQIVESAVSGNTLTQKAKSLSEIVVDSFKEIRIFQSSLKEALLYKVNEFGQLYPNFLPVLNDVIVLNAGHRGIDITVVKSSMFLQDALEDCLNQENRQGYKHPGIKEFAGLHPYNGLSGIAEYEIQCTGVGFAYHVMEQAKIAALELANKLNDPEGDLVYLGPGFDLGVTGTGLRVSHLIVKLMKEQMSKNG